MRRTQFHSWALLARSDEARVLQEELPDVFLLGEAGVESLGW